jgi:hypothetical protein
MRRLSSQAEQIVRFARADILFYDVHVIDPHRRIYVLYRNGVKVKEAKEKSRGNLTVRRPTTKASHETCFAPRPL